MNAYGRKYSRIMGLSGVLRGDVENIFSEFEGSDLSPREKYPVAPMLIDVLDEARKDDETFKATVKVLKRESNKPQDERGSKNDDKPARTRYFMGKEPGEQYRSTMDSLLQRVKMLEKARKEGRLSEEVL